MRGEELSPRNTWWAQALHNRMIAAVLAMVVIIPLVASPADARLTGVAAVTFESFALLLAVMLLWRTQVSFGRDDVVAMLRTGANLPIVAYCLLAFGSVLVIHNADLTMFWAQAMLQLAAGVLLYFVVCYQFRQSKHLSMLVDALLFLAAAVSLISLGAYLSDQGVRGTTLYGNQQPLGSLLMILLPIVVVVAGSDKNTYRQLVALIVAVLTAGSLMLAFTRSAWIGAIFGLIALGAQWLVVAISSRNRQSVSRRPIARRKHLFVLPVIMTVVTLVFAFAVISQNPGVASRLGSLGNGTKNASFQQRQQMWRGAESLIRMRPLTGWGLGIYPVRQFWYTGWGTPVSRYRGKITLANQAHSFYLQTAAELGIPGLLLVVAILVTFVVSCCRKLPQMDEGIRRTLLMGSVASVVAFSVDALSSPSWQYGQFAMFLWLVMGIGTGCIRPRAKLT